MASLFYLGEKSLSKNYLDRKNKEEYQYILDYIKDEVLEAHYYYQAANDGGIVLIAPDKKSTKNYSYIYYENYDLKIFRLTKTYNDIRKVSASFEKYRGGGKNVLGEDLSLKGEVKDGLYELEIYKKGKLLMAKKIALRAEEVKNEK